MDRFTVAYEASPEAGQQRRQSDQQGGRHERAVVLDEQLDVVDLADEAVVGAEDLPVEQVQPDVVPVPLG